MCRHAENKALPQRSALVCLKQFILEPVGFTGSLLPWQCFSRGWQTLAHITMDGPEPCSEVLELKWSLYVEG